MKNRRPAAAKRPRAGARSARTATILRLADRTLADLADIDPDLNRAVARAARAFTGDEPSAPSPVELVPIAKDASIFVVERCRALARLPWANLIGIGGGRHLLAVKPRTPVSALEIGILDILDEDPDERDREILEELLRLVRRHRRARALSKAEILLVHPQRRPS